jgi:ribosomal-protein-alanine N-acetyltransferase
VTRFLTWPTHTDTEVTKYVIGTWLPQYEKQDYYHWAITLKENGDEPIGTIHGLVNDDLEQITVGYCLGRAWWHQGITSEALKAVMDYLFDVVGVNRIESRHDPRNPNSGKVMMKCGMKYEGTLRSSDHNNQGICDACFYALLKSER